MYGMKVTIYKKANAMDVDGFIASSDAVKPPYGYKQYAAINSLRVAGAVERLSFKMDAPAKRSPQVIVSKILNVLICASAPFTVEFYG